MARYVAMLPAYCSVRVYVDIDESEGLSEMEIREKLVTEGVVPTSLCWECSEDVEYEGAINSDSPLVEDLDFDMWSEDDE